MLRVFHRERAGRPLRILWMLEEVGEPYELTVMDRSEPEREQHLTRHPLGRVPVLETDAGLVFESAAMCLHVGDLHPQSGLLPAPGTYERALVYQWSTFAPAELEPPLFASRVTTDGDPERTAAARKRFDAAAAAVEGALDGEEHLVGGRLTVADVLVGTALLFTTRAGFFDELSPSLQDYVGRLRERAAFERALKRTFG